MTQICDQFSSFGFLSGVGGLRIDTTGSSRMQDDGDSEYWPELIHIQWGRKVFSSGDLVTNILGAFRATVWETSFLPALKSLRIQGSSDCLNQTAIRSFVHRRVVNVKYVTRI
jgi:hypothetical protein